MHCMRTRLYFGKHVFEPRFCHLENQQNEAKVLLGVEPWETIASERRLRRSSKLLCDLKASVAVC